jgi:hypothetical protein
MANMKYLIDSASGTQDLRLGVWGWEEMGCLQRREVPCGFQGRATVTAGLAEAALMSSHSAQADSCWDSLSRRGPGVPSIKPEPGTIWSVPDPICTRREWGQEKEQGKGVTNPGPDWLSLDGTWV